MEIPVLQGGEDVNVAQPLQAATAGTPLRDLAQDVSLFCYDTLERNERLSGEFARQQQRRDNSEEHSDRLVRLKADLRWSEVQLVNEGCRSVFAMEAFLSSEVEAELNPKVAEAVTHASYCAIEDSLEELRRKRVTFKRKCDSLGTTATSVAAERDELLRQMDKLNEKSAAYSKLDELQFCDKSTNDRIQQPAEWRVQQCLQASAGVAAVQSAINDARAKLEAAYAHRRNFADSRVEYVEFDERGHPTRSLGSKKREVESFITKERRNLRAYELVMSELSCGLPPA